MATYEECSNTQIGNDINILLLGETGVGKSTFINSFINYLQFDTFEEVCANVQNMHCLIPTKFTIVNDDFKDEVLHFGSDVNESTAAGESATLKTKTYVFHLPNHNMKFRIIDTPGIGDTRGINQDHINQENIINTLSKVKYINAICLLLKPNQPRCTITLQYCINQILMCLHKTAVNNIIFIFTNTSNSFFTPGETVHSLQKILKDIEEHQNIIIPFNKKNTFCIDNESFRYLLAQKSNFHFGNEKVFLNSWVHSHNEYLRMVKYATDLIPHKIDYSLYLSKVRKKFEKLCQSLMDTADLLKSDSILLKKLQNIIDGNNADEIADAQRHMKEVEDRTSKYEQDRNDCIMQISKLITFLQTNSIVVFNNCSHSYISYLIDRENSMGLLTDRKRVRVLYDLMKYYEGINNILKMDVHIDPFSPVMTREELSTSFPCLEDVTAMYNATSDNDVQFSIMQNINKEGCQKESTKDNESAFTFAKWFNAINDSVIHIAEQVENSLDYEELRMQYIKKDNSNIFSERNVNKNNFSNEQFTKSHSNFNHKSNRNKSHNNQDFFILENTNSPLSIKHKPKQDSSRKGKSFSKTHTIKSHVLEFPHQDEFVVINSPQQTKSRGNSHSSARGRGRGGQGTGRQSKRQPNTTINEAMNQSHNKIQQTDRPKGSSNKKIDNKTTDNSNSLLQSMKTLFD